MAISEQARRIRSYADQQWLAKQEREYQRWEEARTMFPSTLGPRPETVPVAKGPGKLLSDSTRGACSQLGGQAVKEQSK